MTEYRSLNSESYHDERAMRSNRFTNNLLAFANGVLTLAIVIYIVSTIYGML